MFNRKEYNKSEKGKATQRRYKKQWDLDNQEHVKACKKQWDKDNKEHKEEYYRQFIKNNPEKAKRYWAKHHSGRRELGFNPFNKDFEGTEAHHINKNDVIYILKELHRSISHCLKTGRNMDKINKLAMESIR